MVSEKGAEVSGEGEGFLPGTGEKECDGIGQCIEWQLCDLRLCQ